MPITIPYLAHAQFIAREAPDAATKRKAMSVTRARQLMDMPSGKSVFDYRDRAILNPYVYSGIRLATGCRLKVADFQLADGESTIRIHEKGEKRRTIELNTVLEALQQSRSKSHNAMFQPRPLAPHLKQWPTSRFDVEPLSHISRKV